MGCSGFKPSTQIPPPITAENITGSKVFRTATFASSGPISGTYVAPHQNPSGVVYKPPSQVVAQPMYESIPSKIPGGGINGIYSSRTGDVLGRSGSIVNGTVHQSGIGQGPAQFPSIKIMPPTE